MSGRVVALDIGGTFIKSGVFENGKLGAVMKTPTGAGSLEEIKRSVSEAVEYTSSAERRASPRRARGTSILIAAYARLRRITSKVIPALR